MRSNLVRYWKPLLAMVFWGTSFIATKVALEELAPLMIIFFRLIFAILLLTVFAVYTKRDFSIKLKSHRWIVLLALIASFHLWIQVTGLQYTTAVNTGWIIGTAPVFIAILSSIFFGEKLTIQKISGIVIAFAGLLLLISKGDISKLSFMAHKGDFLILASAFTWSVYSIVNKKITINYSPVMTILFLFIMMAIIIGPFTISSEYFLAISHLSLKVWSAVLFLGIFCSGISYVLWAKSLSEMEATKTGAFLYFEPFVTVIAAWLLLNEKITAMIVLSGLIIMLGVYLVNRRQINLN
jgi:drug/metabolite transporter (DMT)-like permease